MKKIQKKSKTEQGSEAIRDERPTYDVQRASRQPLWTLQGKLAVSEPGDKYEKDAERVADQVVRMAEPKTGRIAALETGSRGFRNRSESDRSASGGMANTTAESPGTVLQRRSTSSEPRDRRQGEAANGVEKGIRQPAHEGPGATSAGGSELPEIQRNPGGRTSGEGQRPVSLPRTGGRRLSRRTRTYMEPRFRTDFSDVRVHDGSRARATAARLNAMAFTTGRDIYLGPGRSESDSRLMAHELTHVVQQRGTDRGLIQRAEVDTSGNCQELQDSKADVNQRVNEALKRVRDSANSSPPQEAHVIDGVYKKLGKNKTAGRSKVEVWAADLGSNKVAQPAQEATKYAGVSYKLWNQPLFEILNPTMKVDGICIGSDKLGHFFQQGYQYYRKADAKGGSASDAEKFGKSTEAGGFGLSSTGVYSRADLAANRSGLDFYKNVDQDPSLDFDISNYITSAWNEQENTSFYKQTVAEHVWPNLLSGWWSGTWSTRGGGGGMLGPEHPSERSATVALYKERKKIVGGEYSYTDSNGDTVPGEITNVTLNYQTTEVTGGKTPVSGVEVKFNWSESGLVGKGQWRSVGESHLVGTWGTGSSRTNGGIWNLSS